MHLMFKMIIFHIVQSLKFSYQYINLQLQKYTVHKSNENILDFFSQFVFVIDLS